MPIVVSVLIVKDVSEFGVSREPITTVANWKGSEQSYIFSLLKPHGEGIFHQGLRLKRNESIMLQTEASMTKSKRKTGPHSLNLHILLR